MSCKTSANWFQSEFRAGILNLFNPYPTRDELLLLSFLTVTAGAQALTSHNTQSFLFAGGQVNVVQCCSNFTAFFSCVDSDNSEEPIPTTGPH